MVRSALSSIAVLAAVASCGGGSTQIGTKYPPKGTIATAPCEAKAPEIIQWDGSPPAPGSVFIIGPDYDDQGNATPEAVAYEVDPKGRQIRRALRSKPEDLMKVGSIVWNDTGTLAGTIFIIYRPPPPPPDGLPKYWRDLVNGGIAMHNAASGDVMPPCDPLTPASKLQKL
jgi:hypothetical protein